MPPAYSRIADAMAHKVAIDELTRLAWAADHTESVQDAIAALRAAERERRQPAPTFRFDRSRHGTEARVAQVMQRLGAAEPMPNGLCE